MQRFIPPFLNRRQLALSLTIVSAILFVAQANAAKAPRARDFMLLDQFGAAHQLYYFADRDAVVLLSHSGASPLMQKTLQQFTALQADAAYQNVPFFAINADPDASRQSIRHATGETALPVLVDEGQLVARELQLTHGGEAILLNPKTWEIVYRGPVVDGGKQYLKTALNSLLNGKSTQPRQVAMSGDYPAIALVDARADISYADTIAPLLQEKCVKCHRPGGIGPWAMTSYTMVRGFAPMIKEVVLTRRMPPWHADPHVNAFKEDLSLSVAEKQTLIGWINAGAPRGNGDDPLTKVGPASSDWVLGEPDLIVEFPSFDVPASGVVDYQFFEIPTHLDKDVWVRAVQTMPGERAVLHHAIVTFGEPVNPGRPIRTEGDNALTQQQLMTFVPGNEQYVYPEGTGLLLKKGSSIFSQMHYTPYGRAVTDTTRLGIYFRKDAPEHVLRHYSIINPAIEIPAGSSSHQESAYYRFHDDAVIYSLFPHAHYRGASSKFLVRYPDGREKLVLSVPHYSFNWQRYFQLDQPMEVPAGTLLIHRTTWDNSAANPFNPDPSRTIRWGLQSSEEMLYGGVSFRYKNEGLDSGEWDRTRFRADVSIGYMDKNEDGKLEMNELPQQMQKRLGLGFALFDANQDGGLEVDELEKLFTPRRQQ